MTRRFLKEIQDIIQEFQIISQEKYSFQGILHDVSTNDQKKLNSETYNKLLVAHLASLLYQKYHCRQFVPNYASFSPYASQSDSRDFVEVLSEENVGHGTWEPGWIIYKFEKDGRLEARKNGLSIWVTGTQFAPVNGEIKVGSEGYVSMPKEYRSLIPGFYMANGNAPLDVNPIIVRIYWNIEVKGAHLLMRQVTSELNANDNIAFQFKIINNPDHFLRTDAAVLYINKKYLLRAIDAIHRVHRSVKEFLKPDTPLFAKRLAPGLSLAEDPHTGESFGQHRSRILADSLYHVYQNKDVCSPTMKVKGVIRYLKNSGIDIDRPYLNPGSINNYDAVFGSVFA